MKSDTTWHQKEHVPHNIEKDERMEGKYDKKQMFIVLTTN